MSFPVFEAACVVVVLLTLGVMARARGVAPVLREYASLAVAGWIGEQTSIAAYRFYSYAPEWHVHVGFVPLLVPLIWPLVILSARDVVSGLWPSLPSAASAATGALRPLAVALVVIVDASLVEVVAVRAGLWSWAEPGHLAVPVIGILGWGYFAFGAELALMRGRPLLALITGPVAAHALILGTWWGLFRWTLRGDLGVASSFGVAALALAALGLVVSARRAGQGMPLGTAAPRMIAASLFFTLLVTTAPRDPRLWAHVASVAVPYFAATQFRAKAGG